MTLWDEKAATGKGNDDCACHTRVTRHYVIHMGLLLYIAVANSPEDP